MDLKNILTNDVGDENISIKKKRQKYYKKEKKNKNK